MFDSTVRKNFMKIDCLALLTGCALLQTAYSQAPASGPVVITAPAAVPAQPVGVVPASVSPAVAEVLRLAESGVTDEVLLSYVRNVQTPFSLSADTILYLKDLGLSTPVLTAMLNRDSELHAYTSAPAPTPPTATVSPAQPADVPPPAYETNPPEDVNYFYGSLNPYGTWVVLDGVGWCWQPRCGVINHSWRPYCDSGYWVNTDCGWYWRSSYSWGWAPFHYGRWCMHERCGWVWCPDRVWAPAWVTWRVGSDHCGWAPLPPRSTFAAGVGWTFNGAHVGAGFDFGLGADHFTFVAVKDFNTHEPAHYRLSTVEAHNAFSHATVVNNTAVVNNNVLVNQGVPVQRVAAVTHTEIKKAVIRDAPASSAQLTAIAASERNPSVVYRHELPPTTRPTKVVAQRVDAQHPVVQHTTPVPARMPVRMPMTTAPGRSYSPQANLDTQRPWPRQQLKQSPTVTTPPHGEPVPRYSAVATVPEGQTRAQSPRVQSQQPGYPSHVYYPKGYQQNVESRAVPRSFQSGAGYSTGSSVAGQTGGQVRQ
jgi:hypothetical protein